LRAFFSLERGACHEATTCVKFPERLKKLA
jgi:hypothetical protein